MNEAEESVCAILRGDVTSWPIRDGLDAKQLVAAALRHNIHLVLFDTIKRCSSWSRWPVRLRTKLENAWMAACAFDLLRERELRRVLARLDDFGLRPILLKGAPLAYTLYKSPALRPRGDTDLMIRESDAKMISRILCELGYAGEGIQTDRLASYQCQYKLGKAGTSHTLDVHWKINNAPRFAEAFTFDELEESAIVLSSLAPFARGLGYTHALAVACMHRFGHAHAPFYVDGDAVYAGDYLSWVYDIHLLSAQLEATQWAEFTDMAQSKCIAAFCLDGLNAAMEAFKTPIPAGVLSTLQTAAATESIDAKRLRKSAVAWFIENFRSWPQTRQRIAWVREMAFPTPSYMMRRYRTGNWLALPFIYIHRAASGILKRVKMCKPQQSGNR
jgi:hypothetical protein